jgi:AhpC/TSA family
MFFFGDVAPPILTQTQDGQDFNLYSCAGKFSVIFALGSLKSKDARKAMVSMLQQDFFPQSENCKFYALTTNANDCEDTMLAGLCPENRILIDKSGELSRTFGLYNEKNQYIPTWLIFDPNMKLWATGPMAEYKRMIDAMKNLPDAQDHMGKDAFAPCLIIPRVFEPLFAQDLSTYYGHMLTQRPEIFGANGAPVQHPQLRLAYRERIAARVVSELNKVFGSYISRIEHLNVSSMDESQPAKPARRHNEMRAEAHRRFVVMVNLNDDYEGGEVCFPEYGGRLYRAPAGGALVFSASLLAEFKPITKGFRLSATPYLYDEHFARVRYETSQELKLRIDMDDLLFPQQQEEQQRKAA